MQVVDPEIKTKYLLRLGDTALVLSQRLSELCGKGPALEEDIALANTALDLLGQARLWLGYAGELEGKGRDEDDLAFLRSDREFSNFLLVEQPNGTYAHVVMRGLFFDAWHTLALRALTQSRDARIAEIAAKSLKEATYHLRRSSDLVVRLGDGTEKSHALMQESADALWPYTGEMFAGDGIDEAVAEAEKGFRPAEFTATWLRYLETVFATAMLRLPRADVWMQKGGKQGVHSEHLGFLLAEMQVVKRAHPGAKW